MKKLLLSVVFSLLYITSASAGVNVGVSGAVGIFSASAKESNPTTSKTTGSGSEYGSAAFGSVFAEAVLADKLIVGVDYLPSALETETAETAKSQKGTADAITTATNKIQVDFEHMTTLYAGVMLNDNLYVKAGFVQVDVITNEDLGTGSSYGDTELDGSMFGFGYHNAMDNGMFIRVEGSYMDFDGATQTSSSNADRKIELTSLDGVTGKVSFGKSF